MEDKTKSLEIGEKEDKVTLEEDENDEEEENLKNENNSDYNIDTKSNIIIGNFNQAPKFLQENEYIKSGYVVNCTTFKKALRCLFLCHNETVNTWTHLLGAIFFITLIFYTIFFVTNFKIQIDIIKKDLPLIEQKAQNLKESSPNITEYNDFYNSIKNIHTSFNNYIQKAIHEETINKIFNLYYKVKNFIPNLLPTIVEKYNLFVNSLSSLKNQTIDLMKLEETKTNNLETSFSSEIKKEIKERPKKELTQWPIFVIIGCAFLCFSFSAIYHAFKIISPITHNISHRFDYGGISLLISGSCFPPYYYFFYYEKKFKYFYLIEISTLGLGIFLYTLLSSNFSKPKRRTFRGILFLIFGICTGIPIVHMTFFGNTIKGYVQGIKLINWYLGGICYIIGALFYILRFPEKKFEKTFDYLGSSHQIFHTLVCLGAAFHYFGSLDAYNYRFKNLNF